MKEQQPKLHAVKAHEQLLAKFPLSCPVCPWVKSLAKPVDFLSHVSGKKHLLVLSELQKEVEAWEAEREKLKPSVWKAGNQGASVTPMTTGSKGVVKHVAKGVAIVATPTAQRTPKADKKTTESTGAVKLGPPFVSGACDLCGAMINNEQVYHDHVKGKRHMSAMARKAGAM